MDVEGFDQLLRDAQSQDEAALKRLLVRVRPYLTQVASGYSRGTSAMESVSDLLQETEMRVWQRLDQFQGGSSDEETSAKFRAWIVQIVRRIALDRGRARQAQKRRACGVRVVPLDRGGPAVETDGPPGPIDPRAPGPTPSAGLREEEVSDLVDSALGRIEDEGEREILRLFFFEQRSLAQIAEQLDRPYDQIRGHYHRGLRQLERLLRPLRSD